MWIAAGYRRQGMEPVGADNKALDKDELLIRRDWYEQGDCLYLLGMSGIIFLSRVIIMMMILLRFIFAVNKATG